jgi:uncharacterized membrane protein
MAGYSELEKIDIGRVLKRAFGAIGRNAAGFILLSVALAGIPTFGFEWIALSTGSRPQMVFGGANALTNFAAWLLTIFTTYLLNAALVRSVILDLSGRPVDLQGSLAGAVSLVLPMVGLAIVSTLGVLFGIFLLIVPGIIFYIMWIVAVPVLVEEGEGVFDSMSRSADLTQGSRWQIFALLLIFLIFFGAVSAALRAIVGEAPGPLVAAIVGGVTAAVYALLASIGTASLYVELRTVKEGATADGLADIFA